MTLGAALRRQAKALVGRERELELLRDDAAPIVWLHGIAGSGKTAVLRAFAGEQATWIDCRTVEPTEQGFRTALGDEEPELLIVDGFHALGLLDGWLRTRFLPQLPAGARIVIASREAPLAAWMSDFGPLMRTVALGPLAPSAAEALLRRSGMTAEAARQANRFAHGHPLSLVLAANAPAMPGVVDTLAQLYLDGLDAGTRRALDAASVTRRVTLSLLGALLPDDVPHEAFERLRALPFTELGADGLIVQDTVRETVAALLRARDPAAHRRLQVAAWHLLRDEMRDAPPERLWRYTADMLYLIENPLVRAIYFPTTPLVHAYEPALPGDWEGIETILRAHESPEAVAVIRRYWEHIPDRFVVARNTDGTIRGYYFTFVPRDVSPRVLDADPVACAWRDHLRRDPLPHGQIPLFIRHWATLAGGMASVDGEPSICLDIKRTYLELRPALGRVYLGVAAGSGGEEELAPLGFRLAAGHEARLGDQTFIALAADFGPGSVDGWLADLGARELHLAEGDPFEGLELTRLERGVLAALHASDGRVVTRADLFREVWGTDHLGDGNALEAVVSTLRRKLGPRATALQTVRGAGYRLTPL
jgi:Transcriptional regulatory protein, C terminal